MTADIAEKEGLHKLTLSGTKFRKMLRSGGSAPGLHAQEFSPCLLQPDRDGFGVHCLRQTS